MSDIDLSDVRDALARLMRITDSTDPGQQARFAHLWDAPETRNPWGEAHAFMRADAVIDHIAPLIEAAVREQIARDIEADREVNPRFGPCRGDDIAFGRDAGLERAAAIARGES